MRIAPAEPPFLDPIRERLERVMPRGVAPLVLFTTLARSPRVFERFMAGSLLDRGPLSMRHRELMIARTCARCDNAYEWGIHLALFGGRVGFDEERIAALATRGWDDPLWLAEEQAVLRLADELDATTRISDEAWELLRAHFDEARILELIALAGFYRTVAYYCNGLRLAPEPHGAALPRPSSR